MSTRGPRRNEWYIRRDHKVGSELAQSYIKAVTLGCTPLTAFACFRAVYRERRIAVRSPTRDTGHWYTIVALFGGRGFRTCGGACDLTFASYVVATKELISWMHRDRSWLSGIARFFLFPAWYSPMIFPSLQFRLQQLKRRNNLSRKLILRLVKQGFLLKKRSANFNYPTLCWGYLRTLFSPWEFRVGICFYITII